MKIWFLGIFFIVCWSIGCAQQNDALTANDFQLKYHETSTSILIDLRTPAEYSKGFIAGAVNVDFMDADFINRMKVYDLSQQLFVYCKSGARSKEAVQCMLLNGFTNVYELKDGLIGWKRAALPVNELLFAEDKISLKDFENSVMNGKVLVDFYAPWCKPCKKMEPYLFEVENEMNNEIRLLRINIDENENLVNHLSVYEIPVLQLYQDGKKIWEHRGYLNKMKLIQKIKSQKL